jgi:hypothetical protein
MYSLIHEFVVADMAEFQQLQKQQQAQPDYAPWFKQYQQFVEGGRREYYTIEGPLTTWSQPGAVVVREAYRAYKWQMQTTVSLLQRYGGLLEFFGVGTKPRVLTDLSGPLFQAVIEVETESLSHWETQRRGLFRQAEFQVWFNQMMTSVEAGAHELYRVEYSNR